MGNVSISKKGKEVFQYSLGYSDVSNKIKNSNQTKFRIGSVSKSFTAVMIMQLIDEGELTLNDKLDRFIPNIPNGEIISIEQLLTHKSGLFNITESDDFFTWMESFRKQEEILDLIIKNGTVFDPGNKTEYSNTNYILLSLILEKIDQKKYSEILNERIAIPCQLNNTYYGGSIGSENQEAFSYEIENVKWQPSTMTDMSVPIGAGSIVSTPSDLNSFYFQIFNGDIVSKKSLKIMTGSTSLYEYALYPVFSSADKTCFGHEGRIDGFHTYSVYFPEDKVSISFCANGDAGCLEDVFLQTLAYFHSAISKEVKRTFVKDNYVVSLVKANDLVLLNSIDGTYFFLEKKGGYKLISKENKITLTALKGSRLKFQNENKKIIFSEIK